MSDININSDANNGTSELQPGTSANKVENVSLDDAFLSLANAWENSDGGVDKLDTSNNQEIEQDSNLVNDSTQSQATEPENNTTDPEVTKDTSVADNSGTDYRQLYEQALKEREVQNAQLGLLYSRLGDLSDKYQELKTAKAAPSETKPQLPTEVQELYDIYPEIARAVEKLIESKVSATEEGIKKVLEPKTELVQQQLHQVAAQSYINRVLAVHPDTMQLVQSNALRTWINSLEPLQKTGADFIMKYGSAEDVIGLISQYKSQTKAPTNSTFSTQSSEDALVKKVIAAMGVASKKQEPATVKPRAEEYASVEDAFDALAKKYEAGLK